MWAASLFSQNQRLNFSQKILTDSPVGLPCYNFKCYLLIKFVHTWNAKTNHMIYPILPSKLLVFSIWTQQPFACSKSTIRTKFEICSQLTMEKLERRHWHRFSVFILNLEQFSHLIPVLQLLTLNRQFLAGTNDITNKPSQNKTFSSI